MLNQHTSKIHKNIPSNPFRENTMTRGWMAISALALFLVFALGGCRSREPKKPALNQTPERLSFSSRVETDSSSGKKVVVLRLEGGHELEARICPEAGANLFSLVFDGVKLILGPERSGKDLRPNLGVDLRRDRNRGATLNANEHKRACVYTVI